MTQLVLLKMSAYRQAMLSIAPERLEQFSLEVKQNIVSKKEKKVSNHHKHAKSKKSDKKHSSSKTNDKTRKRAYSKNYKLQKKKKKTSSEQENLTDESDVEKDGLNLEVELYPLSYYVKDRQNLCAILFRIVKKAKLVAMLPDILKEMPLDELKQKCLSHLEVMSSKRINHILLGEAMESSSGTESDEEHQSVNEAVAKEQIKTTSNFQNSDDNYNLQTNFVDSTTSSGCEVLSLLAAGSERETGPDGNDETPATTTSVDKYSVSSSFSNDGSVRLQVRSDIEEEIETVEVVEDEEYVNMVDEILEETLVPSDDQIENLSEPESNAKEKEGELSQLELLELQLRARAIKSLMKATQTEKNNASK